MYRRVVGLGVALAGLVVVLAVPLAAGGNPPKCLVVNTRANAGG